MAEGELSQRGQRLREAREAKMAEWFQHRRWRVCTELTSESEDLVVRGGEFWVRNGKVFRSPFGNKGTHGYILQEIDVASGLDRWRAVPSSQGGNEAEPVRAPFGWVTINHASEMFPGSIVQVPPRPYGQRGGVSASLDRERQPDGTEDPG